MLLLVLLSVSSLLVGRQTRLVTSCTRRKLEVRRELEDRRKTEDWNHRHVDSHLRSWLQGLSTVRQLRRQQTTRNNNKKYKKE